MRAPLGKVARNTPVNSEGDTEGNERKGKGERQGNSSNDARLMDWFWRT
jgi:hypothetical protein